MVNNGVAVKSKKTKKPIACAGCGGCCRYIIIDLPYEPRSEKSFDEIIWFLYHDNIKVLKEGRRWSLMVMTQCKNLDDTIKCRIYNERPDICRDYPPPEDNECHGPDFKTLDGELFSSAQELLEYLTVKRKKDWAGKLLRKIIKNL